ncbi:MAG: hypothetical protein M1821_000137 [Bathelium mastoideum]|nr:MAG: hypothetical protein M1821_000137 [Bathelium mastoideum]KAI9687831.1 MAG: hypothetical protein M1822_001911 [Bathelium mastoideum]
MPGTLPPYPTNLYPEAPLTRIPLSGLLAHDSTTAQSLFTICQSHGFFYLDLATHPLGNALLAHATHLQTLAASAFRLPPAEKEAVSFARTHSVFGFKPSGQVAAADVHRRRDRGEFWNIAKDDILTNEGRPGVEYPAVLRNGWGELREFVETAHGIGMEVLDVLAARLGIEAKVLRGKHRLGERSGDHVRMTWAPGLEHEEGGKEKGPGAERGEKGRDEARVAITTPPHTDFGSVTLLFNWAGGLQIESPKTGEWEWVRPVAGHAICNLGDAMVEFSGGKLRSGKHRVVAAPGEQAKVERYSLVYFVRPEDEMYLEDLTTAGKGESENKNGNDENGVNFANVEGLQKGQTRWKVRDWIMERAANLGNKFDDTKNK